MKFKVRNRPATATRAPLRAAHGDVELAEELAQVDDCKPDDVSCWVNENLLGGHKWVPHDALQDGRAPGRGRDMEIAGEAGRPGARQATKAVEANANRTLVGDPEELPGYALRRGDRG